MLKHNLFLRVIERPCWHTAGSFWTKQLRGKATWKIASHGAYEKDRFCNKSKTDPNLKSRKNAGRANWPHIIL